MTVPGLVFELRNWMHDAAGSRSVVNVTVRPVECHARAPEAFSGGGTRSALRSDMLGWRKPGWGLIVALLPACTLDPAFDASAPGALGKGTFHYRCVGSTDAICVDPNAQAIFPDCIALGSSFRLSFEANADEFADARLQIAGNGALSGSEPLFTAVGEGPATILAMTDERIVDLRHFSVEAPTGIGVVWGGGVRLTEPLMLAVDQVVEVEPHAEGSCAPLGGTLPLEVVSADEAVVRIHGYRPLRLAGVTQGATQVRLRLGDVERAIEVVVTSTSGTTTGTADGDESSGDTDGGDTDGGDTDGSDMGSDTDGSDTEGSDTDNSDTDGSATEGDETETRGGEG
jgi:hypothetical protein